MKKEATLPFFIFEVFLFLEIHQYELKVGVAQSQV